MNGSRERKVGNITIGCMSKDARDLLDLLIEKFKEENHKDASDVSGYMTLYWACRYSGLIEPSTAAIETLSLKELRASNANLSTRTDKK